jgi:glyoxylase-like metal-dependent hydrolase (beta-lactamase superfamily II)
VPGRLDIADRELELHPTGGHTEDGMALVIGWAGVLVAGDYLSPVEIPTIGAGWCIDAYLDTLERLQGVIERVEHVVPGHGPLCESTEALGLLEEDSAYLMALRERGQAAELPAGRRGPIQAQLHSQNVATLT